MWRRIMRRRRRFASERARVWGSRWGGIPRTLFPSLSSLSPNPPVILHFSPSDPLVHLFSVLRFVDVLEGAKWGTGWCHKNPIFSDSRERKRRDGRGILSPAPSAKGFCVALRLPVWSHIVEQLHVIDCTEASLITFSQAENFPTLMQGHRSSDESLPETFEFDPGASSNNSGMDQQIYWNNILNQVETQNLPNYLLPTSDANMMYMDISDQDNASLSIWSPGGPSSSERSLNQGRHNETKMEHEWTSLTINAGGGTRIEERRFDGANMLSLENVNINLNSSQVDDGQPFSQNYNLNDVPQNPDVGSVGISSEVPESGQCPHPISGIIKFEHAPCSSGSSNPCMNSSTCVSFMSEDGDDRPGSSLDGRRLACKRKTIEGFPGQSSASGSASFFHQNENRLLNSVPATHSANAGINLPRSSDFLSDANSSEEQLNPRLSTIVRGMASECYPSPSVAGNPEGAHRNFRMRINPGHQHDISPPNLYTQGSTIRRSCVWLPHQPSSLLVPFTQSLESRPVIGNLNLQSQPHIAVIPGVPRSLHPFPWNGASNSRIGSSSNISSEERLITTRDDTNSRNIPRNSFSEHSLFIPTTNIGYVVQDPTSWSLENASTSMPGNVVPTSRTGTSSGVHPPIGRTWVPYQNSLTQYPRSLSEEIGHQSAGFHGHQQPYMRSAFFVERQSDGVLGVPLSMHNLTAAREGRSRMISEIQNALDLIRRSEHLRFESLFHRGADLHDRHRDMRLDVDNMSYEELLALEERIGNVSTGVSEETVSKRLNQHKYLSVRMEAPMGEEPCCICQEEYSEGEDLGSLDCGHGFHTACIKQWLTHKNLCPICKTTALVT